MAAENANLSSSMEDYLEAIFNLSKESNIARSKDIAKSLGVSRASVTGALRVLKEKGLANYKPYDYVTLTETGRATAAEIAKKHKILESFFIDVLGIESKIAQEAACKAEHALGPGIIEKLLCFIEFVSHSSENGCDMADQFQKFCKKQMSKSTGKRDSKNGAKKSNLSFHG
ncbi:MAG: metal-dependent transcriptional regulator [Sedimentisphaerales bacterium]